MPSWWGKSSSKEAKKKKTNKESLINTLKKFRIPSDNKSRNRSAVSEKGSLSTLKESKHVARCQSFQERSQGQPLPLPAIHPLRVTSNESGIDVLGKPTLEKGSKVSLFTPHFDFDGAESVFSECYSDSDDPRDSSQRSPLASDYDTISRTTAGSPTSMIARDQSHVTRIYSRDVPKPRAFGTEQIINTAFYSGQCSSPVSGQNSGHNSMGGDMAGIFWQPGRGSPEYSPLPSPRMTSPGPSSRIHSGAVTPLHPRAGGSAIESQSSWPDDGKQQSHRLPLPPISVTSCSPFSQPNSAATSPSLPRSPGRAEYLKSPGSRWKKGKLLGRGSFGHVYIGFNSETGEMCAMKEVTLFADDTKSNESAKQLGQEVSLLSRLSHPNIVQYYGSEMYGQLGELAIRSYTQQILSGLAYLHAKNTIHRDIKGANILVDPNGRVKLADFGMAKHINGQACPLSFKGSPYWMAPEIINNNTTGSNLAVDIWSLGCTVLEMATTKPPWSQYEGVAALFKIGNSKELPAIPDHLSDEGKDFVKQCLQRNPHHRPTAAQLLDHPFVRNAAPLERAIPSPDPSDHPPHVVTNGVKSQGIGHPRNRRALDHDRLANHSFRVPKPAYCSSDLQIPRNIISCPVSPIGSPLLHSRSPQHQHINNGWMSPSPISSGASSPLTSGGGCIPFHHINQSVYLHETSKANHNPYTIPVHDIFRSKQPQSHARNQIKQFSGPTQESYGRHALLADSVSHLLLQNKATSKPSSNPNP
ncbi:mitogen-activated protein kinase kinase kinase YODA-like isoform X2 [Rutidosis leptorrhynchoides]|uniref:mitogen-activated protein kinase kinase kinase YODA-like isoform X2 n=1 Tax=Rutidosis leptorrhynchoides TaxID=125765 RepID=UPI003A99C9ED